MQAAPVVPVHNPFDVLNEDVGVGEEHNDRIVTTGQANNNGALDVIRMDKSNV